MIALSTDRQGDAMARNDFSYDTERDWKWYDDLDYKVPSGR